MKQIGTGMLQYVQDYDEAYPAGSGTWLNAGVLVSNYQGWAGQIYPYVKSLGVYQCPDETLTPPLNYEIQVSYAMNYNIMKAPGKTIGGLQASQFTSAANTVAFFEAKGGLANECSVGGSLNCDTISPSGNGYPSNTNMGNNGNYNNGSISTAIVYATGQMGNPFTTSAPYVAPRHTDGSNFLAADGHVKWLKGDKVSNGTTSASNYKAQIGSTYGACGADAMQNTAGASYTMTFSAT